MKSTCVFTTARLRWVPPWRMYFFSGLPQVVQTASVNPDVKRQDRAETGDNFFRLPSLALLIDDIALQEYAHPMESRGIASALKAPSAMSPMGMLNRSATPCRKAPFPDEHCELRRKSVTVPL